MKFIKINGINTLILNDGESINISNGKESQVIVVSNNEESIITQNYPELKKININEQNKNLCEIWLELFKKVTKTGYNLTSSNYGIDNKLSLRIDLADSVIIGGTTFYNIRVGLLKTKNIKGDYEIIDSYLKTNNIPKDVYKYLFGDIINFIIKEFYQNRYFKSLNSIYPILFPTNKTLPIEFNCQNLDEELNAIFNNIIKNHNNNKSIENIVNFIKYDSDLRNYKQNDIGIDLNSDLKDLKRLSVLYENSQKEKSRVYK